MFSHRVVVFCSYLCALMRALWLVTTAAHSAVKVTGATDAWWRAKAQSVGEQDVQ